jgi:hypothetical protein
VGVLAVAVALALLDAGTARAKSYAAVPPGAYAYSALFDRVAASPRPAPIESLLVLGLAVGDTLLAVQPGEHYPPLDGMDDSTRVLTARLMKGFELVDNGVYQGLIPDFDFFARLAAERGDSADVAIFETIRATMNSGSMPAYIEQRTDDSGCTRFGSGSLVETYARWQSFLERFPGRYVDRSAMELEDVRDELLTGDCACDDRASVVRELTLFLEHDPKGKLADLVRARRKAVRAGKVKIREHCSPG